MIYGISETQISTQASTPTFPTGAAQCDRLLRVNDIRELTGWSENTARKFMRESGKLIQIHRSNYMFESSFYELFKQLEGRTAHLD